MISALERRFGIKVKKALLDEIRRVIRRSEFFPMARYI
jgi:hypothetical protein